MSSDNQYTALGPASIGFQTDSTDIDVGADIAGNSTGVKGRCDEGPGVVGESTSAGVKGRGLQGVYGLGANRSRNDGTGVLGEGYQEAFGVTGLCLSSDQRTGLGHAAGVIGASNGSSASHPSKPGTLLGAGVVGLSKTHLLISLDDPNLLPLPTTETPPDGEGTGVWGASGTGVGVHGQSQSGRGGVFESARIAQLRLVPSVNPNPVLPATGEFGDLYLVVTGHLEGHSSATLYMCVRPGDVTPSSPAWWAPFQLGRVEVGG